jgi:two-component system, OmpR family, response regulator QseB
MSRLLLVEDDRELAALLDGLLVDEGYDVDVAPDGQRGLHLGLTRTYDVIVLDRGLPGIEGLDLLGRLRSKGVVTPMLVLSARGNPADRVEGLDAGAEDYLPKPFDVDELLARLRGLLRRHVELADVVRIPGGSFDIAAREVGLDGGEVVSLSTRETDVLGHLARSPRRVFSRVELLAAAFGDAEDTGLVDTYVHYLRRKLGRETVLTVRGVGYRLGRL